MDRSNYRKTWLFSHNDLDGFACNVVARVFILGYTDELLEMNCDYSSVDGKIRKCMPEIDKENDLVIVSDISWNNSSEDITEFLSSLKDGHLVVADHHKTSEWISREIVLDTVVTEEGDRCGCEILRDILKSMGFYADPRILRGLDTFIEWVSDWDLWKWVDEPGVRAESSIAMLMFRDSPQLAVWFEWCIEKISNRKFLETVVSRLYDSDRSFAEGIREEYRDKDFLKYMKSVRDAIYCSSRQYYRIKIPCDTVLDAILFVIPKGFQHKSLLSLIANIETDRKNIRDIDCIAVWVEGDDSVSLRYPRNGVDLSDALKTCDWEGGGHPYAAGIIPGRQYMERFCKTSKKWEL